MRRKIALLGSRSLTDNALIADILDAYLQEKGYTPQTVMFSTGASEGACTAILEYARTHEICCEIYIMVEEILSTHAMVKRNTMILEGAQEAVVFWDKKSVGTANMIEMLKVRGIPHAVFEL